MPSSIDRRTLAAVHPQPEKWPVNPRGWSLTRVGVLIASKYFLSKGERARRFHSSCAHVFITDGL
jgi:hypothetical protein